MSTAVINGKKLTSVSLRERKADPKGQSIIALTAYDYTFAKLVDELVDVLLVGDSLGMVIQGNSNTLGVTLEHMIYHARAVSRAALHAHVVVDMPFMSFQTSVRDALKNAGRLLSEGGAEGVKLEGGAVIAPVVERLVEYGIPVMGHIGLTPQSVHAMGGYRVQGKTEAAQYSLMEDALALEDAGAYALVLEGIPAKLAREITERIKIPTIGIGAGRSCDGQVLVNHDLLGLNPGFNPRFVKRFAHLGDAIREAVSRYGTEVRDGKFPDEEHSF